MSKASEILVERIFSKELHQVISIGALQDSYKRILEENPEDPKPTKQFPDKLHAGDICPGCFRQVSKIVRSAMVEGEPYYRKRECTFCHTSWPTKEVRA